MVKLNIDLPESFFQEEERNGYLVSAKIKELWAVQLDLLNEFDRVCKKHNLKYFLDFGSLLGAVRHKGFIPWDEDIDVSMLREDYDKLMEIGPKEFKHPYFLQSFETDKGYNVSVTRLRRSDTTFLQPADILNRHRYNLGVFLDVFVYDNMPSNNMNEISKIHNQCMNRYSAAMALSHHNWKRSNPVLSFMMFSRFVFYKFFYRTSYNAFKQMDSISRQFKKGDYVSCVFTSFSLTFCRERKWLEETVYMPFESIMAPVPVGYDEVLRNRYGDYETPVIDESAKFWFFDTDQSYKELIDKDGFYDKLMKDLSVKPDDYLLSVKDSLILLKRKIMGLGKH